jgi:hypothetical protein
VKTPARSEFEAKTVVITGINFLKKIFVKKWPKKLVLERKSALTASFDTTC